MIKISPYLEDKELLGSASKKRQQLNNYIFKVGLGCPCVIAFIFPFVLGEQTIHVFNLDKEDKDLCITKYSLFKYIESFSDEMLSCITIHVLN